MKKNISIAAAAADFQATLTNELGETIKKSVLFYIHGRDHLGMVSSFEREMIAENAWFHVIEKREKYKSSKDAKFSTWAKKVAQNFASDELDKLQNDPLHLTGLLNEDQKVQRHGQLPQILRECRRLQRPVVLARDA